MKKIIAMILAAMMILTMSAAVAEGKLEEIQKKGVLIHADAVRDRNRLLPGEDGRAGIALFIGAVPILVIAGKIDLGLSLLHLGLLQAIDIRIGLPHIFHKALAQAGAQAVDVPGNQFHPFITFFLVYLHDIPFRRFTQAITIKKYRRISILIRRQKDHPSIYILPKLTTQSNRPFLVLNRLHRFVA